MSPWKSPAIAVDAVLQTEGQLRLDVHGPDQEPAFADYIGAMKERAATDSRIAVRGPYDQSKISEIMAETDVVIVPSTWYENTPFVSLEAFEAGVPVIASDLGGMAELIDEGKNGFTFKAGDPADLARVLRRCIDNPQMLKSLAPTRPGTIADNYDAFLDAYRANA